LYPKIEESLIELLYSPNYVDDVNPDFENDPKARIDRFADLFEEIERFRTCKELKFLDFGCGSTAEVVMRMSELGVDACGLEVETKTRLIAQQKSGCSIFSLEEIEQSAIEFDVIFLGDVLEHLNDPRLTLDKVFNFLAPAGTLIVQGPLEGAPTISNFLVSIKSMWLRKIPSQFPPYHVSLATRNSLLELFTYANFEIKELRLYEPLWPAAKFGSLASMQSVSSFIFSVTKVLDIVLSRCFRGLGTRFYLEARKTP
jgi:2-polyprenyl-3-methyl-5-hydroxy-6-metoxy-1,4-benzoquinol methylase